jgi:hypothetical protein
MENIYIYACVCIFDATVHCISSSFQSSHFIAKNTEGWNTSKFFTQGSDLAGTYLKKKLI